MRRWHSPAPTKPPSEMPASQIDGAGRACRQHDLATAAAASALRSSECCEFQVDEQQIEWRLRRARTASRKAGVDEVLRGM